MHRMACVRALALAGALSFTGTGCPQGGTDAAPPGDAGTDSGGGLTCQGQEVLVDDGRPSEALDTCVRPPSTALSAEVCNVPGEDFCDAALAPGTAPNLGACEIEVSDDVAGALVVMRGVVDIFGEGNSTLDTIVTLFAVDDVGGTPVAGPVNANTPCTMMEDPEMPPSGTDCASGVWCLALPTGNFCGAAEDPAMNTMFPVGTAPQNSFKAYYEFPTMVETGVPLVALVEQGGADDVFVNSYQYDVYLTDKGGFDDQEVNVITYAAYLSIPATTSVGSIPAGNGVIAGTIHDCDDLRIGNATIGFSTRPGFLAYFNGVFDDPTPEPGRSSGTNIDGIYAGLDLPAGVVRVHAQARVGGVVLDVAGYDVEVFPDSVTLLTLRGRSYTPGL